MGRNRSSWGRRHLLAIDYLLASSSALLFKTTAAQKTTNGASCTSELKVRTCTGPKDLREYVDSTLSSANYDKLIRPGVALCGEGADPDHVEVQFRLTHLSEVNQVLNQITIGGYMRWWWKDPRLAFNDTKNGGCFDSLDLDPPQIQALLWQPNLYVDNLVVRSTEGATASLIHISPDGLVWRSEQMLLTLKCSMTFSALPYDSHHCGIVMASYSEDISRVRVYAKGGRVGEGSSGVGISSVKIESPEWLIQNGQEGGFETAGTVEISSNWDYVSLMMDLARIPGFFVLQIILPDLMFLSICYLSFYIDANAAPARASLATIPVLIMLTLRTSIYSGLPQISTRTWLADYIFTSMMLCIAAAMEYGLVCSFLHHENYRAHRLASLRGCEQAMQQLHKISKENGITLEELLAPRHSSRSAGKVPSFQTLMPVASMRLSLRSMSSGLSNRWVQPEDTTASQDCKDDVRSTLVVDIPEVDLTVLEYAHMIFMSCDLTGDNCIRPRELRILLKHFNVYMRFGDVVSMCCMYLHDADRAVPTNAQDVKLNFSQWASLIFSIGKYRLGFEHPPPTFNFFSQTLSPSSRADCLMRTVFPILVITKLALFYILLDVYYAPTT